jgi:hypothetical protein
MSEAGPTIWRSISVRFSPREYEIFENIVTKRNAVSHPANRCSKTHVVKQSVINWIADNQDIDPRSFTQKPSTIVKHDI